MISLTRSTRRAWAGTTRCSGPGGGPEGAVLPIGVFARDQRPTCHFSNRSHFPLALQQDLSYFAILSYPIDPLRPHNAHARADCSEKLRRKAERSARGLLWRASTA